MIRRRGRTALYFTHGERALRPFIGGGPNYQFHAGANPETKTKKLTSRQEGNKVDTRESASEPTNPEDLNVRTPYHGLGCLHGPCLEKRE